MTCTSHSLPLVYSFCFIPVNKFFLIILVAAAVLRLLSLCPNCLIISIVQLILEPTGSLHYQQGLRYSNTLIRTQGTQTTAELQHTYNSSFK